MKEMYRKSMVAAALAALVSTPAMGQYVDPMDQLSTEHPAASRHNPSEKNWPEPPRSAVQGRTAPILGSSNLTAMTPNDLEGQRVFAADGKQVGRVLAIVQDAETNRPHAVIAGGGFVGVGDKEIVVPLSELSWTGEHLQANATIAELGQEPQYMGHGYVAVRPEDQPISEFSAFEIEGQPYTTYRGSMMAPVDEHAWGLSPSGKMLDRADPRRSSD